jgi:hypothetical protein
MSDDSDDAPIPSGLPGRFGLRAYRRSAADLCNVAEKCGVNPDQVIAFASGTALSDVARARIQSALDAGQVSRLDRFDNPSFYIR